jgi:hypothetical protein
MSDREEIANTLSQFMNSFDLKHWGLMVDLLEPSIQVNYSQLLGDVPTENRCDRVREIAI